MKTYNCICCGFEIKPVYPELHSPTKSENGMWVGGTVEMINMPYGSELDGDSYIIAICDMCIESKYRNGIIERI